MFKDYEIIDLTQILNEQSPTWPNSGTFQNEIICDYEHGCRVQKFSFKAGSSTHMDAPMHFTKNGRGIANFSLQELIVPACVINVSDKVKTNSDYAINANDINAWEQQHGAIPQGSLVLAHTGWSQRWSDEKQYRNTDSNNVMHFPGYAKDAAELLVKRNVVGIGIDTLSLDCGIDNKFLTHQVMLSADKYQLENLNNLEKLPAIGALVMVMPMKIENATEAPARVIALIPRMLF